MTTKAALITVLVLILGAGACVATLVTLAVMTHKPPAPKSECEQARDEAAGVCYRARKLNDDLSLVSTNAERREALSWALRCNAATEQRNKACGIEEEKPRAMTPREKCDFYIHQEDKACSGAHFSKKACEAATAKRIEVCKKK
jgi:hypothetical protein